MQSQSPPNLDVPVDKPYHSKRPHKKSRSGCRTCKTRKVKCDEARPACRNCTLRKATCVYPNPPPRRDPPPTPRSDSSSSHSPVASSSTAVDSPRPNTPGIEWFIAGSEFSIVVKEPQFRPADVSQTDMKLLWWYSTFTYTSFSTEGGNSGPVDSILRITIPQKAFETPFLMDMLLSLTASHVQFMKQNIEPDRVVGYRARAFEGYRKAVAEANPGTYPALLAGSLILSVVASQMFREKETKEFYILDWIILWRGIGLIIDLISPKALWESGMAELFYRPPLDLPASEPHIPEYLMQMVDSIRLSDVDYPDRGPYRQTLIYLGSLYHELRNGNGPIMTLRVITWFTFLPKEFIDLARQKRPIALVILAHYLVFTKLLREVWWTNNIGDREIPTICSYLGPAYFDVLRAPAASVGVSGVVELGRLLFRDRGWVPPGTDLFCRERDVRTKHLAFVDDAGRPLDYQDAWIVKDSCERQEPHWNYNFTQPWKTRDSHEQQVDHLEEEEEALDARYSL